VDVFVKNHLTGKMSATRLATETSFGLFSDLIRYGDCLNLGQNREVCLEADYQKGGQSGVFCGGLTPK
jgi:hypothetical protein